LSISRISLNNRGSNNLCGFSTYRKRRSYKSFKQCNYSVPARDHTKFQQGASRFFQILPCEVSSPTAKRKD
jgi:hypothetical protein